MLHVLSTLQLVFSLILSVEASHSMLLYGVKVYQITFILPLKENTLIKNTKETQ